MGAERLDELARGVAAADSRRALLKLLAGSFAGVLLGLPRGRAAAASCRTNLDCPPCQVCSRDGSGCVPRPNGSRDTDNCGPPFNRFVCCNGACTDLWSTVSNCGRCGNVCRADQGCSPPPGGCSCREGTTDCQGACRRLDDDPQNCGRCGNACAPNQDCFNGSCVCTGDGSGASAGCPAGQQCCHGKCYGPCADRQRRDPFNCICEGCLPSHCPLCQTCDEATGTCVPKDCGPCRDCVPSTGLCQSACAPCAPCLDGICGPACAPCQTCDAVTGRCVPKSCGPCESCDPTTGACRTDCDLGQCQACVDGSCQSTCTRCQTCQNGGCVPLPCPSCQTCDDATGACIARRCGPCETCSVATGQCTSACGTGQVCCGDGCVNSPQPPGGICCLFNGVPHACGLTQKCAGPGCCEGTTEPCVAGNSAQCCDPGYSCVTTEGGAPACCIPGAGDPRDCCGFGNCLPKQCCRPVT